MSEPLGSYAFLSWIRRGIGAEIVRVDGTGTAPRAEIPLTVSLNQGSLSASVDLAFFGPGEVAGLDPRVIVRVWPHPDVSDAESNFLPFVEFSQPDLPWRYTPARANSRERLRPWLCLATLRDDETDEFVPMAPQGALPRVKAKTADALPSLAQSWAWGHVQVSGSATVTPQDIQGLLENEPHRVVARLVSPRRLEPDVTYTAYLVPVFERGRLAGLGREVPADLDGLRAAWNPGDLSVELPVYFFWRFRTGSGGDFEFLVRQLKARPMPKEVGVRAMDVGQPGAGLPSAASAPLDLEGALVAPTTESSPWPPAQRDAFVGKLRTLVNRPADLLTDPNADRVVAPPLYGRWHARQDRLQPANPPIWFEELNSDPRLRVTAGLGTLVVQDRQQPLMAAAWKQVERIREANEQLRFAQLARELAVRIHERHLVGDDDTLLEVTAPVHARVKASPLTVRALLAASPVGAGPFASGFRRVMRPRGPIARRVAGIRRPGGMSLFTRLNRGDLNLTAAPLLPDSVATLTRSVPVVARRRSRLTFTADRVRAAAARPDFIPVEARAGAAGPPGASPPRRRAIDNPAASRFRSAAAEALDLIDLPIPPGPELQPVKLADLRGKVLVALDPRATIAAGMRGRLSIQPGLAWQPTDPLEPVMAYPEFDQPMYEPLRDLSQDWLLPRLDLVPPNTVSLLKPNRKFIEAYMAGLNHEMGRELLWNEYPTDQRGSYFRQFWDVRGFVPPPGQAIDRESLRDIRPVDQWNANEGLGENPPASAPFAEDHLVLLIRGELLRRYPTAIIYAAKTLLVGGLRALSDDPADERYPLFVGKLKPDVTFLGFDLTEEQVVGSSNPTEDQGWYFVIQEQPTEPRFGLDLASSAPPPLVSWNDLEWGHLAAGADALSGIRYIDLDADLPDTSNVDTPPGEPTVAWHADSGLGPAGSRAAEIAYITLQRPVRVAIHGSDMLP